jgi:alpha-galactosidase
MKSNFLRNMQSADFAGPGHWNDPDMLEIGTGLLTSTEEATHFALWAFAKAPLIISADLNTFSSFDGQEAKNILSMANYIDINQDKLGR